MRDAIKRKKELNRAKRVYKDVEEKNDEIQPLFSTKVKGKSHDNRRNGKHKMMVETNIRQDKSRGKKIWENIDKPKDNTTRTENI